MTTARGLTFTTTVRVIDRVHRDTAVGRTNTLPAITSSLTDRDVLVIGVADLAHRRHAGYEHAARFTRGQLEQCVVAFLGDQLRLSASGTNHLRTFPGPQFHVVDCGAGRNVLQRQRVANEDVRHPDHS